MIWRRIALVAFPPLTFLQGISFTSNERAESDCNLCCVMNWPLTLPLPLSFFHTISCSMMEQKTSVQWKTTCNRLVITFTKWDWAESRLERSIRSKVKWSVCDLLSGREKYLLFWDTWDEQSTEWAGRSSGFDETIFPTAKFSSHCLGWERLAIWEKEKEAERSEACRNVIYCFVGECSHQLFVITPFHCFSGVFLLACSFLMVCFTMAIQNSMNGLSTLQFY